MAEKTDPNSTEDDLANLENKEGQTEETSLSKSESAEDEKEKASIVAEKPVIGDEKESDDHKNELKEETNTKKDVDVDNSAIITNDPDEKNPGAETKTDKEEVETVQDKTEKEEVETEKEEVETVQDKTEKEETEKEEVETEKEEVETVQEKTENKINPDPSITTNNVESETEIKEENVSVQEETKENGNANMSSSIDKAEENSGNQTTKENDVKHESIEDPETEELKQVDETENNQKMNEEKEDDERFAPQASLPPSIVIEEENLTEEDLEYPPPFSPKESLKRSKAHYKLRCYESRRRTAYGSKLTSSSLYWRSFRELVHLSLKETMRAERIVTAHAVATTDFAIHMRAIQNNTLDNNFRPVTNKHILKDMLKPKKINKKEQQNKEEKRSFKLGDMNAVENMDEVAKSGKMLSSILESQNVLADRYEECAASLKDDVSVEVTNLRKQLEKQVNSMQSLGDAILECLEAAEKQVVRAWDQYYSEAQKNISNEGSQSLDLKRRGAVLVTEKKAASPLKDCTDLWLSEMRYRMAVAFLSACWEKCSAELSRLFGSMKETECSRRHRLRELLLSFLQKEERLWLGLPSIIKPALEDISGRTIERAAIEEEVQSSIRLRAQAIQRNECIKALKTLDSPGLGDKLVNEGNFELSSPLISEELCIAKVMEAKSSGMMRSWRVVLAIITTDSTLHLFELPPSLRVQSGSAPEVAFHALVPPVEIPTETNMDIIHTAGLISEKWNENLSPAQSIVLANTKIEFENVESNSSFELIETVFNHGARNIFGKISTRKIYFKTSSYYETKDWISALRAQK